MNIKMTVARFNDRFVVIDVHGEYNATHYDYRFAADDVDPFDHENIVPNSFDHKTEARDLQATVSRVVALACQALAPLATGDGKWFMHDTPFRRRSTEPGAVVMVVNAADRFDREALLTASVEFWVPASEIATYAPMIEGFVRQAKNAVTS